VVNFHRDIYCLLGLPFDAVDMAGAVWQVRLAAAQRTPCWMSTPNLNFAIGCRTDDQFRDSVIHSDLVVADGMPLVWIARLLDIPIRDRIAGSTMIDRLRDSSGKQLSIFFFGGPDGAAEAACRRLRLENKGLTCLGYESPGFGTIDEMSGNETIQRINSSGADFLLIALGAKKGQAWIERNRARIAVPVISHLGAVVNFVAGRVSRAPVWMQRSGLEWLWRIKEERTLWRRYFSDGLSLIKLLVTRVLPYAWYLRRHRPSVDQLAAAAVESKEEQLQYVIYLRGSWAQQNLVPIRECFSRAVLAGKDVRLEMDEVTYVDSAFLGLLILLQGYQKQQGRQMQMVAPQKRVRQVIRYCCAEYLCVDSM